jgi:ABC-type transport system involved in multi-copper enzyme maturation permease subunit
MNMPRTRHVIIKIAAYTLSDHARQKSFLALLVTCALLVFLTRGCYQGNYMVNGRALDAETVVEAVSKVAFHVIAVGAMLIAALLSMRAFRRDRDDGMQSAILSRPITRWQYVLGKVLGLWVLSTSFMFILDGIVFLIAAATSKVVMPGYLAASLLCSFNLLFVIVTVLLLSLLMPDMIAFLCVIGIGVVGLVADGIYALGHSEIAQAMIPHSPIHPQADVTWGNVLHYAWPKLSGAERFASSFIGGEGFQGVWSAYPFINILLYCLILGVLLLWRFRYEEIV